MRLPTAGRRHSWVLSQALISGRLKLHAAPRINPRKDNPRIIALLPTKLPNMSSSFEKKGSVAAMSSYTLAKRGTTYSMRNPMTKAPTTMRIAG